MSGCNGCPYGSSPDPLSDVCDGCRNDPDTGWGGFTDHYLGMHFSSYDERDQYESDNDDLDCEEIED